MSEVNDGGLAYPYQGQPMHRNGEWGQDCETGMTLRDWFAGQALSGSLGEGTWPISDEDIAEGCYRCADAMIKERSKGDEG